MGKNEEKSRLLRRIKARRLLNKQKPLLLPTKHATTNKLEIFLADGKSETKKDRNENVCVCADVYINKMTRF